MGIFKSCIVLIIDLKIGSGIIAHLPDTQHSIPTGVFAAGNGITSPYLNVYTSTDFGLISSEESDVNFLSCGQFDKNFINCTESK